MNFLLYAWEHDIAAIEAAEVLDISQAAVERAFKDFASKNRATKHLRETANTLEK